jgi:hypothetical protein
MLVTLSIPDETYQKYAEMNPEKPVQMAISAQLKRFEDLKLSDRALVVPREERVALERAYGRPIEDFPAFVRWIEGLSSLTVDGFRLQLSDGQRKRLAQEAAAWLPGRPAEEYVSRRLLNALVSVIGA